jgi:nitrate reductase NapAB chaperone NapD
MLQNKLSAVKGQLLEMMFHQYLNMNTDVQGKVGIVDYSNFFEEIQSTINSIRNIKDLSDLEIFCEEFGLNDIDNEMSFPNLVKEAYK